jgi:hypothetical protein
MLDTGAEFQVRSNAHATAHNTKPCDSTSLHQCQLLSLAEPFAFTCRTSRLQYCTWPSKQHPLRYAARTVEWRLSNLELPSNRLCLSCSRPCLLSALASAPNDGRGLWLMRWLMRLEDTRKDGITFPRGSSKTNFRQPPPCLARCFPSYWVALELGRRWCWRCGCLWRFEDEIFRILNNFPQNSIRKSGNTTTKTLAF